MPAEVLFANPIGKFTDLPPARQRQLEREELKKKQKQQQQQQQQQSEKNNDDNDNTLSSKQQQQGTSPRFFQNQFDLWKVCHIESSTWVSCMKELAEFPKSKPVHWDKHCTTERNEFTKCVVDWRETIRDPIPERIEHLDERGKPMCDDDMLYHKKYSPHLDPSKSVKVRVKGKEGRMLPPQCDDFRLITQRCMFRAGFETSLCKAFGESAKYCTRYLYGQDFVDEKNTAPMPTINFKHGN